LRPAEPLRAISAQVSAIDAAKRVLAADPQSVELVTPLSRPIKTSQWRCCLASELVRLAGSLELIRHETKVELVSCFIDIAVSLTRAKRHCAPYLAALGLLLNRDRSTADRRLLSRPILLSRRILPSGVSIGLR
jgi:hypothetical protein